MDKEDVRYIYIYTHTHTHTHTYTHTMEYYLVIEENEILPFTTTQMDLEGIMLCEINQTEKDKYCMISLICEILKTNKQIQRTMFKKERKENKT